MSLFTSIFGDPNKKIIKELQSIVERINAFEEPILTLSDESLSMKTMEFKKRLSDGISLDELLPEAYATVREVSRRVTGMRHFDVQLMGGVVLHRGNIAEMKTGEGKTLTSTLPIYLNALLGKGVHIVTVNDYLAARDAVWMGQIFDFLGLSVACIQNQHVSFFYDKAHVIEEEQKDLLRDEQGGFKIVHDYLRPCSRQEAYRADITYGTNNEFGFDYLRDNMVQRVDELAQRALSYAIIDEIDSILIDEARTPLIISAPAEESTDMYKRFATLVLSLSVATDYNIDEKMRSATLTEVGVRKIEELLGVENLYDHGGIRTLHHLEQALKAETLFQKDRDYVVKDDEIIIVDEFTGRLMPGRRYSEGLHQAIEAKEGVVVQRESRTLATITFQNYFRLYDKIAGMTGTAATEAEEFQNIYGLEVVVIPTNKPGVRRDLPDKIFKNESGKFQALTQVVKELHANGQPVLIGTVSIEKNEILAEHLHRAGVPCTILNAKNHEKEAQIIAQAGKSGSVVVATNMAGRGVDIILGGNPPVKEDGDLVRESGGLFVIGTERHESRRIDNQLRGRSARQGDTGFSQFYLSMDDDIMRIFGSDRMKSVMNRLGLPDDVAIENGFITRSIEMAQKRVEGYNFDRRKHVLEYDDVLNKHRTTIYQKRRRILEADDVKLFIVDLIEGEVEQIVSFHTANESPELWNIKEIIEVVSTIYPLSEEERTHIRQLVSISDDTSTTMEVKTKLVEFLIQTTKMHYEDLENRIAETFGENFSMKAIEKNILLRSYDILWVDHLEAMSHMRLGIGLSGYGQRDPLVEYKKEAFRMFAELQNLIQRQVVYSIFKLSPEQKIVVHEIQNDSVVKINGSQNSNSPVDGATKDKTITPPLTIRLGDDPYKKVTSSSKNSFIDDQKNKLGRNDFCHCGSGKKYKKCHGS